MMAIHNYVSYIAMSVHLILGYIIPRLDNNIIICHYSYS